MLVVHAFVITSRIKTSSERQRGVTSLPRLSARDKWQAKSNHLLSAGTNDINQISVRFGSRLRDPRFEVSENLHRQYDLRLPFGKQFGSHKEGSSQANN